MSKHPDYYTHRDKALNELKAWRESLFIYVGEDETDCEDPKLERKLRRIIQMLEAM